MNRDAADDALREDLAPRRQRMLERDLAGRGITSPAVLAAMAAVRREEFLPPSLRVHAYDDAPLRIGSGQTISQPYVVAFMSQALRVEPGMKVLEIGTGSGYQTAVLVELGAEVFTVERHDELSLAAERVLDRLGYGGRVTLLTDDGTLGWPEEAPRYARLAGGGALRPRHRHRRRPLRAAVPAGAASGGRTPPHARGRLPGRSAPDADGEVAGGMCRNRPSRRAFRAAGGAGGLWRKRVLSEFCLTHIFQLLALEKYPLLH